jgi:hypothetical protein
MKLKASIFISILILTFITAYPAKSEFFKLRKAAVSSIPEELVIPDLKSVSIDPKGNIFAFAGKANGKECFIIKFNEHLEYLKHFGRDGKGPAEFTTKASSPRKRISIDTNGDVYVVDYNPRRFVIFDNEGKYKEDILIAKNYSKLIGSIYNIKAVGNGTFIGLQYRDNLPTMGLIFTLSPPEVKVRHSFNEKDIRFNYISYVTSYYGENCIIDADSKHIVFGNSQIFRFYVYDMNGNLKMVKEDKNRVMKRFGKKEMKYIIRDQFTPKVGDSPYRKTYLAQLKADRRLYNKILNAIKRSKNVILDIKISGEKIYVFTVGDDISVEDKCPVEVYNLKGELIKKGYFKEIPARIWKNYAFFYSRDTDTDDPLILKYKILGN